MKNFKPAFTGLFFVFFSLCAKSQITGADYFAGKWNVLVKGLPDGDTKLFFVLEKSDSVLTGNVLDSNGVEVSKFDSVEFNDSSVTVFFTAQGYDVDVVMKKQDEDHIIGSMMGMFDADGVRVKEEE